VTTKIVSAGPTVFTDEPSGSADFVLGPDGNVFDVARHRS